MHKSPGKPNWLQLAGNAARRNYIIGGEKHRLQNTGRSLREVCMFLYSTAALSGGMEYSTMPQMVGGGPDNEAMRRGARGGGRRTGQTIHQWVRLGEAKTPSVRGCARPPHAFRSQSFQPTASRFELDWCSRSLHVSKQEGTSSFPQGTRDIPERTSVLLVTGRLASRHSAIAAYVRL